MHCMRAARFIVLCWYWCCWEYILYVVCFFRSLFRQRYRNGLAVKRGKAFADEKFGVYDTKNGVRLIWQCSFHNSSKQHQQNDRIVFVCSARCLTKISHALYIYKQFVFFVA